MKYCVIILDGASGWPVAELSGKTTLQAASTPNLDELAASGMIGTAVTVPEGLEPSSSAACMSILGYDPVADYVGRGAIEAASMGIQLAAHEIALRLNLVNTAEGRMQSYSAGHIGTEESSAIALELAEALNDGTFTLYPGVAYRHILVVSGHPELLELTYTPPHDISGKSVGTNLPNGPGAQLLRDYMDRARVVLRHSPVNATRTERGDLPATDVWPFWPGVAPRAMIPFSEMRGVSAAMTSGVDLLNGLGVLAGIDRLEIQGVTDGTDNDYAAQAAGALAALDDHDLVIIHVESPDEEGHSGDCLGKIAAIEAIDREIVARVRDYPGEIRILAMPDHPTPIELKTHVGEPVPFVLAGPGIDASGTEEFDEEAAHLSGVTIDPGSGVIGRLLA